MRQVDVANEILNIRRKEYNLKVTLNMGQGVVINGGVTLTPKVSFCGLSPNSNSKMISEPCLVQLKLNKRLTSNKQDKLVELVINL